MPEIENFEVLNIRTYGLYIEIFFMALFVYSAMIQASDKHISYPFLIQFAGFYIHFVQENLTIKYETGFHTEVIYTSEKWCC